MSTWSITKANIINTIENLVRRFSKTEQLGYRDYHVINDAINGCLVSMSIDRGGDVLKCITDDVTVTTTAGTNYVDLEANVINVVDGTVRIAAEGYILSRINVDDFYALDTKEESTGKPTCYAIDYSGSATRLLLRSIPDATYTIALKVEEIPDLDSVSTLPGWMHDTLIDGCIYKALHRLGFINESMSYRAAFEDSMKNVRDKQRGSSGAIYMRRRQSAHRRIPSELRRPE